MNENLYVTFALHTDSHLCAKSVLHTNLYTNSTLYMKFFIRICLQSVTYKFNPYENPYVIQIFTLLLTFLILLFLLLVLIL